MKCFNKFLSNLKQKNIKKNMGEMKRNVGSGLDNVFATLPAIILMPLTINNLIGIKLFDLSFIIFLSGFSSFLFLIFTRGHVPCCLGSSFAFINVTVSMYKLLSKEIEDKSEILSYILGAYICSGLIFVFLATVTTFVPKKIVDAIIPPAVLGPAISLIGLELSGQAIEQTQLNRQNFGSEQWLALITILFVIVIALIKRKKFNSTSISLAIFFAITLCIFSPQIEQITKLDLSSWSMPSLENVPFFSVPNFQFVIPNFKVNCCIMIIPATLILFCEYTARRIMIDNLLEALSSEPKYNKYEESKCKLILANSANGLINFINPFFHGVPMTIYAESTAVMRINKNVNKLQFLISSLLLCGISFFNCAIFLINKMPQPIVGGVSLVLMGIIAVPGLKILVDEKIDYNKLSNLLLSASVLLIGLSDISLNIFNTEIKGMGLGLICGMLLNGFIKLLQCAKALKDDFTYEDIYEICQNFSNVDMKNKADNHVELRVKGNTYAYLEIKHSKVYCNVVVENQYYLQHKEHLGKTNDISDELIRCSINIDKISKKADLVQIIQTSYKLCEKVEQEKSVFTCLSDQDLSFQEVEEQTVSI